MTPQEAEHILKKACLITTPDVEPSDLEEHFKYAKDQHGRSEFTYDDCIKAIQLAAESGNEWISVKDRLPEESLLVVAKIELNNFLKFNYEVAYISKFYHCWQYNFSDDEIEREGIKVTHWMPLPKLINDKI